jgi:hypothetical protein
MNIVGQSSELLKFANKMELLRQFFHYSGSLLIEIVFVICSPYLIK